MAQLEDLLAVAMGGDRSALNRLFAKYRPLLHLIAQQNLGAEARRREDASDVVQRTELEAYRSLNAFRGKTAAEFTGWVKQILRRNVANVFRDHRAGRRDVRRESAWIDDDDSALTWRHPAANQSSPSCRMMTTEAALDVAQMLHQLPEAQRAAIRMRHLEGRSIDEIAQALEKSRPAVAGLLRRGLQALRGRLEDESSWV